MVQKHFLGGGVGSTQLKCDLSGLSVNVAESKITQSSKVRALGVILTISQC